MSDNLVIYFSAEDSSSKVLRRRLRANGANLDNILCLTTSDERLPQIKFNSNYLASIIAEYKPTLCIFDPLQAFIPADIHMGERNAMRQALAPLKVLGSKYETTFLIVCHSNKRSAAYGRNRLADSADIWDIARSVCFVGQSRSDGLRYFSQEKTNYGLLSQTVLFSIDGDALIHRGYTDKRDREFQTEYAENSKPSPALDEARLFILESLRKGEMLAAELDESAKAIGISSASLKRAKNELKDQGVLRYRCEGIPGKGKGMVWHSYLAEPKDIETDKKLPPL